MSTQLINVQPIWSHRFKRAVYSCIIANLIGDSEPEVIGCSFSAEMKAFDLYGKQVFLTEFSSNITCFDIASVSKEKNIELISGSLDGTVYVMDIKGNPIWTTNLKSPVICMETGDLREDSRSEILVGLEDQRLVGLDNEGKSFLEFKAKKSIVDCTIGYLSDDYVGKIFVLLKSGKIVNVDNKGNSKLFAQLDNQPTCLAFCNFYNQPTMIVGYNSGVIKLINSDKEIIGEYELDTKISCLANSTISTEPNEDVFLVAASKENMTLFKLSKGKAKDLTQTLGKINAQPLQIPIDKEEPKIDSSNTKQSASIISKNENTEYPQVCPDCGEQLPPELIKKKMKGLSVYCEVCGAKL
jgi:WD40 repeat protein